MNLKASTGAHAVRARLEALKARIDAVGHGASYGFCVGDVAAERQNNDDWASGRGAWETAWVNTKLGLEASENGKHDDALLFLLEAQAMAIIALGTRLEQSARPGRGLELLAKPAGRRGRPPGS